MCKAPSTIFIVVDVFNNFIKVSDHIIVIKFCSFATISYSVNIVIVNASIYVS